MRISCLSLFQSIGNERDFRTGPLQNRPPPECGTVVVARPPERAAALRTASEVVRADQAPIQRDVAGLRKASTEEVAECLGSPVMLIR